MSEHLIERFISLLKASPPGPVFNPWWQVDEQNDMRPDAPVIRRRQLAAYLRNRLGKARLAVIGEALGYRGGHFTGIAMTSERILLGKKKEIVAALWERRNSSDLEVGGHRPPLQIIGGVQPHRTSKPVQCADGFSEPTATIVWGTVLRLGVRPEQFVIWNAFAWHSFDPRRGLLSNRMPAKKELPAGLSALKAFLHLFPSVKIVALGKLAGSQLKGLNVDCHLVRHPASGGAKLFRQQIETIVKKIG